MYDVQFTRRAQNEYDKLLSQEQDRIDIALDRISVNPRVPGVRKISANIYRIRIGDWRIIYTVYDKQNLVLVGRISRRSENTYDSLKDLL